MIWQRRRAGSRSISIAASHSATASAALASGAASSARISAHAILAAVIARFAISEVHQTREIVTPLGLGMLCLVDRAFLSHAVATGATLLWRVRSREVLPCCSR